jgi:plastocyanin
MLLKLSLAAILLSAAPALSALAADTPSFTLTIRNHRFEPAELQVPAAQKIELLVINQDSTPEEFESKDLHREKVVPGGQRATITLGPLKPGTYTFFGEFNPKTAQGRIIVR